MNDTIVIDIQRPTDTAGWRCPACHGVGHHMNGELSIGPTQVRYRPATKCGVCNGIGRVNVTPLSTAEAVA